MCVNGHETGGYKNVKRRIVPRGARWAFIIPHIIYIALSFHPHGNQPPNYPYSRSSELNNFSLFLPKKKISFSFFTLIFFFACEVVYSSRDSTIRRRESLSCVIARWRQRKIPKARTLIPFISCVCVCV